ncbi:thioredoxin reductase [Streptomyces sp. 846.5]|nr:FAD-dependent oxidoreductase [Streptomyces sp. 846.5]TDU01813.1 thioredoxin reductase [Streptomyces sp. 846.5]
MTASDRTLAVIGAGPAGLAAALTAADQGVRVTLLDSAAQAGGQFYRQPAVGLGARRPEVLHHAWGTWLKLRDRLAAHIAAGRITYLSDRHVWLVEQHLEPGEVRGGAGFTVHALLGPEQVEPEAVTAAAVLLATGGYEKVLPFPGWTLPGVVTAGGAQAMLKGGLVLPGRTVVVAGTGPLLMPVAVGLAAAGARIAAYVESARPASLVRQAPTFAANPAKVVEAVGYAARLIRHRGRVTVRHAVVEAHGADRVEAVTVAALDADGRLRPGSERRIACDTLAVGHGMLAHTDLAESLGCAIDATGDPFVVTDAEQRTSVDGVWAAGEATGIGGAVLALAEGEIAGYSIAARLRGVEPGEADRAAPARTRARLRKFFAAIDTACAPPAHWTEQVTDDTVVCRCEEVPAGAVREAVRDLGATDLRTVKLLTRAGMGWCQGRICAPGVAGVAGCAAGPAKRTFARPVPLAVLAQEPDGRS